MTRILVLAALLSSTLAAQAPLAERIAHKDPAKYRVGKKVFAAAGREIPIACDRSRRSRLPGSTPTTIYLARSRQSERCARRARSTSRTAWRSGRGLRKERSPERNRCFPAEKFRAGARGRSTEPGLRTNLSRRMDRRIRGRTSSGGSISDVARRGAADLRSDRS